MDFTKSQLMALTRDDDFQTTVDTDPVLDRLWNTPPRSIDDRFSGLLLSLGGSVDIGGIVVAAPTAGTMLLLGSIASPILLPSQDVSHLDIDMAMWILSQGKDAVDECSSIAEMRLLAAGLCDDVSLDRAFAYSTIIELVNECFVASSLIPSNSIADRPCRFDLPWFASLTARVAEMTNFDAEYVGWTMPLALAMQYALRWHVANGGKIDDSPKDGSQVMNRVRELMQARINEKGYK
jgi:hypothetical protein